MERSKIKEKKANDIKVKLKTDKDFIKYEKLSKEKEKLNSEVNRLGREMVELGSRIGDRYNVYISMSSNDITINERNYSEELRKRMEIENKLVLLGLEGIDVMSFIDELVKEFGIK